MESTAGENFKQVFKGRRIWQKSKYFSLSKAFPFSPKIQELEKLDMQTISAIFAQKYGAQEYVLVRSADWSPSQVVVFQNFTAPAVKPRIRYFWAMKTKMIPGSAAISAPAHI